MTGTYADNTFALHTVFHDIGCSLNECSQCNKLGDTSGFTLITCLQFKHFSTLCCLRGSDEDPESVIPREKLVALCKYEPVRLWMRSCDHVLYQALVEILIPDVLRPVPSQCHFLTRR